MVRPVDHRPLHHVCMGESVAATGPLVVTRDTGLRDQVLRLCAAAAVTPDVTGEPRLARRNWVAAVCVLVGADCADEVAGLQLPLRPNVSLVGHAPQTGQMWRDAVAIRAGNVIVVPDEDSELVERLADAVDGSPTRATTVGVIGARGGAGASTLAAALALTGARRGPATLLVDLDPFGGGIELVVGCESAPGLRWPDVSATHGRVSAGALRAALPDADGLAVLSWDRADTAALDPAALASVLAAAQRGSGVVVIDLPRVVDAYTTVALLALDTLLVVCTPDVRSTAGAGRLLRSVEAVCGDVRLVVRRTRGADLDAEAVASSLRIPLAATVPTRRGVTRAIDTGVGPLAQRGLSRPCSRLLADLLEAGPGRPGKVRRAR